MRQRNNPRIRLSTAAVRCRRTFTCHADGQLASATVGRGVPTAPTSESFLWDGLALIQRGDEQFVNEPHVGNAPQKLCFGGEPRAKRRARRARKGPRGNPVASSKGTSYFNDMLGTTVGSKSNGKYSAAALTAFGEGTDADKAFFTGKPMVEGLGHAFLMRNYRASLSKWQTADPMGYPDGWNGSDPIILLSCYTGSDSAVFCQILANILGVSVYAADSIVWYFVVERTRSWWFHVLNNGRMEPDKSRPGNFIEFMPE